MEERFFKFSSFSKYSEIVHGMSTRAYGNMKLSEGDNPEIIKNREQFFKDLSIDKENVVVANLVHGSKITIVGKEESGRGVVSSDTAIKESDGLFTQEKNIFLMVTVFDCLPIMIYDPVMQNIGIVHGGWRGISNHIVHTSIAKFLNFGSDPSNLIVGIGPGICQKHFVVKDEVLELFQELYPKATFLRNHDGYVDLKKAVYNDLMRNHLSKENIEISNDCTVCLNGTYGSYRKEGSAAPAAVAIIGIQQK